MRSDTVTVNPLDGDHDWLVIQIRLSRVFVLRIWLGTRLLKFSMWVLGGRAEVLPQE